MGRQANDTLDLGSWCILRMGSADTLRVFKSLRDAGFDVWTPVERKVGRMPRTKAQFDKEFALMPSYVFANVSHLDQLLGFAMVPNRVHPPFSLFHYQGGIPLIAESQLAALRAEEGRTARVFEKLRRRGMKGPKLAEGSEIRMAEGPFEGLSGIVQGQRGRFTLVSFAGFHAPIEISSLLLLSDVAEDDLPIAARAA